MTKKLILFTVCLMAGLILYPQPVQAQNKGAVLFGFYHDYDSKESGEMNLTPFIGASIPLGGQFFGIVGGEFGENDVGNEYAFSPTLGLYLSPEDYPISKNIGFNMFVLLPSPDFTWADVGDTEDPEMISYILAATGGGMTITVGDRMKIWGAYQTKTNGDYATSRVGVGLRWAFSK